MVAQPSDKLDVNAVNSSLSFEGKIDYIQKSISDTLHYTYFVKGRKVRVDFYEGKKTENSFLFDLDKQTIVALNSAEKTFMNMPVKPIQKIDEKDLTIIKSTNNKTINGYKCFQWRVKSKSQRTEVSYWVANDNFDFFEDFLRLWNRSEKLSLFFLQIPNNAGYFPMLSVEMSLLRDEKMRLAVVTVNKQKVDPNLFAIPKGYKSYNQ
ncbi:MAG: hypothetical protein A2W98_09670 [Bacteroidetes bacterium GWF2_33_38]|nr:MAG: hypothetical protein A2W98_09670 [Bacteroidetes bacterium GWF2_33_38]OFY71609.1 MAG: hypothetical protein A2265_01085 [Bacteroidetes bacterium RIFOXYA12_FULL_33_9]OFY91209.1 MAG: hypothetical protein A2236_08590 [Bacteroidetes bacterium RIFOXYA2_FULL_33_7]